MSKLDTRREVKSLIFYHVDRVGYLRPRQVIPLITPKLGGEQDDIILERFPNGLSQHGITYFASKPDRVTQNNLYIESLFEYERSKHFPDKPSRFQSLFVCKSLSSAKNWIDRLKSERFPNPSIWEIDVGHSSYHECDSSLLNVNLESLASATIISHRYWRGEMSNNSIPELLVRLPVQVVRQVQS